MKKCISILIFTFTIFSCQPQVKKVETNNLIGGGCEGCEAIFEYGDKTLASIDTLPGFWENEPRLKITGTVFKKDGKTPTKDVILYVYHTNRKGIYETKGNEEGWGKRHGYIRTWLRTDKNGKYTFYTFRPAAYPNGQESEHIHITVKEPDKNEYYIDNYVFNDDLLLTKAEKLKLENRGGSGIVEPKFNNGIFVANRDIILGLNIPNYK